MWNTATVYALFPNTLFVTQGDHVEVHRVFPTEGRPDRAVMETGFYVPKAPATEEERRHWQANLDLVIKVVQTEDFPAGRSMQLGFSSGAQTASRLRPQRAGHDPLSPVDATGLRFAGRGLDGYGGGMIRGPIK